MCPEDPERETGPDEPQPGKIVPFPSRRPDWLVGPSDDIGAEEDPRRELPREKLDPRFPAPVPFPARPPGAPAGPAPPDPAEARPDAGTEESWAGPFTDMTRVPAAAGGEAASEDDLGPAGAAPRAAAEAAPAPWAPAASSIPVIRIPLPSGPPHASGPGLAMPAPAVPMPVPAVVAPPAAAAPAPALDEPSWLVALDAVRSSRALQAVILCGLLAAIVLVSLLWPRGIGSVPIGRMRHEPARYDGASVQVRGRVGDDVFAVGSGWAFYLVQGRDTIVAFTRSRAPRAHEVVTLRGQVSTGFLDGVARQALFETEPPPK